MMWGHKRRAQGDFAQLRRSVPALLFLVASLLLLACSADVVVRTPHSEGALGSSVSVQVTASKNRTPPFFNAASFAELMVPYARKALQNAGFQTLGRRAQRHVVVHVLKGGRGTGPVRSYCQMEAYVYEAWPGKLEPRRNQAQAEDGSLIGREAVLHVSFDLEDRRRKRTTLQGVPQEGAALCAERVAVELAKLRSRVAAPLPTATDDAPPAPPSNEEETTKPPSFEIVRKLQELPGNLTVTPTGRIFVSLHQFSNPAYPVGEVEADGSLVPFAAEAKLDSVLGIQSDENGVVWMLDNGMKSTKKGRLVGWHSVRNKLVADVDLSGATPENAFLNDLVIDLDHDAAYIADPLAVIPQRFSSLI